MVNVVVLERDYLLDERLGLIAQVELLQRDLECSRAETEIAKKETWISWSEVYDRRAKLTHVNGLLRKIRSDLLEIKEHTMHTDKCTGTGVK